MAYNGPEITSELPGWYTVEQLRDNLVEFMMLQSPYNDLSGGSMPAKMVEELEKSMTRLAIAIYHSGNDIPEEDTYSPKTSNSVVGSGTDNEPIELVNDIDKPGILKYYGTNSGGEKGYFELPIVSSNITKSGVIEEGTATTDDNNLDTIETPSGTVNGINTDFILLEEAHRNSVRVYLNGVRQTPTTHYTILLDTISFVIAPFTGDNISVEYVPITEPYISNRVYNEIPSGDVDGVNFNYLLSKRNALECVYLNGVKQAILRDYVIEGRYLIFFIPPYSGDSILVDYKPLVSKVFNETPKGFIDEINVEFELKSTPIRISTSLNGQKLALGTDYTLLENIITFTNPPYTGDIILVDYIY